MAGPLLFLLTVFQLLATEATARQDSSAIEATRIRLDTGIAKNCWFITRPKGHPVTEQEIPQLPFRFGKIAHYYPHYPPAARLMETDNYLKFILHNSADTARKFFFLPGFYCRNIRVFKSGHNGTDPLQLLPADAACPIFAGAQLLRVEPGETAVFYCQFNFVRTNVNIFTPYLIETDYIQQWLRRKRELDMLLDIVTYVVSGIMLMMIFYSLAVYLQNRNNEFLYYALYTFLTAMLLFLKSYLSLTATEFHYFYEEYLDFMIMIGSVLTYLIFVRKFLETRENHPWLDKLLRRSIWPMAALSLVFSFLYFCTGDYDILMNMEYLIKLLFLIIGVLFIVYSIRRKDALLNYLAAGSFALIFFSVVSQGIIMYSWRIIPGIPLLNRAMFYYELGLVLELICFLSGLAYKNRRDIIERVKERERLKLENERKEFEKQMAVMAATQQERDRISADMHDELGSGVTAIRLMSEILKSRMKDRSFPELEKISSSANDLLGKMNTIIWTMKSSNDTLESLIAYIRANAIEYFDNTPIDCSVRVPAVIPQTEVSGEKRRNIFLGVKESLNNAMKHSQATTIRIDISIRNNNLLITVTDNGVGIDTEKLRRFGNGLSNMRRRMEAMGGHFKAETHEGAMLTFEMPL
ncbi:MAG: sensor histidine kinase [Candidatus Pseudobacter hemicellulosilyticus]|uniref:histidine kinase n=1 Tax=Candidatus Pseudobacter hemicellulosilyticus TaxID=3121375 RepID=A0AAJ6BHL4_9BACT|nr:MAG: sensor histidine kinase [Pseudobacter sp.]